MCVCVCVCVSIYKHIHIHIYIHKIYCKGLIHMLKESESEEVNS